MINFYLAAGGIVLFAAAFVLFPIFIAKKKNAIQLSNANVVKQRIVELEREVEEGLIDSKDKDIAIRDLKVALVDEMPSEEVSNDKVKVSLFVLLAVPAFAIGGWVYWQSNQLTGLQEYKQAQIDIVALREQMQQSGGQGLTPDDYAMLALSIRTKLREEPEDATGWSTLGLVSSVIGRLDESIAAYQKALDLQAQNDSVRFKYAETLMLSGTEEHLQNATRQLNYLISKAGDNRNYRLLLTTVAIKLQDASMAQANFDVIKGQLDPNSQFYQSIVAELSALGLNIPKPGPDDMSQTTGPLVASDDITLVDGATTETIINNSSEILITVNVSDEVGSKLPEQGYLIVFAQRNDGSSRAPLAVKRMTLRDLPVEVSLSDTDAMIPSMNLSSVDVIKVTARISLDENVMPAAGELEGSINDIKLGDGFDRKVTVIINREL